MQDGKDQEFSVQKLIAATKPTKLAYKILARKNSTCPQKSQEKRVKDCGLEVVEDLSWRTIYLLPRMCTISTKIRNFQFKFLHRRIATNIAFCPEWPRFVPFVPQKSFLSCVVAFLSCVVSFLTFA